MTALSLLLVLAGAGLLVLAVVSPREQRLTLLGLCVSSTVLGLALLGLSSPRRGAAATDADRHDPPPSDHRGPPDGADRRDVGDVVTPARSTGSDAREV